MTEYTKEQKQQVTEWLTNLSHRHLCALASQQKLVSWANMTSAQIVKALEVKGDIQRDSLEMVNREIKTHGESVQSG